MASVYTSAVPLLPPSLYLPVEVYLEGDDFSAADVADFFLVVRQALTEAVSSDLSDDDIEQLGGAGFLANVFLISEIEASSITFRGILATGFGAVFGLLLQPAFEESRIGKESIHETAKMMDAASVLLGDAAETGAKKACHHLEGRAYRSGDGLQFRVEECRLTEEGLRIRFSRGRRRGHFNLDAPSDD
jgi:hypothetical protein